VTLSKSQIDKLGERLRTTDEPSTADRDVLARLLASYASALEEVRTRIDELAGFAQVTGRFKSTPSIIEKLKRNPKMQLSRVQDLAGVRGVLILGRVAQDFAVERVRELFPKSRVKDRRAAPQHGYRAVHVICDVKGKFVEVQIRTPPPASVGGAVRKARGWLGAPNQVRR
jgi:ppGpp synthetase/RelA/SpoT-type nucleotidyltranferase